MNDGKKIGLALGGGAARGFAHMGVLKVLEEAGIEIHAIAGTSIGALVGAIYAHLGRHDLVQERFDRYLQSEVWKRSKLQFLRESREVRRVSFLYNFKNFLKRGLMYSSTVTKMSVIPEKDFVEDIATLVDDIEFSELSIPFGVMAVDLGSADQVFIRSGSVRRAVCASCSIPGIFPPIEFEGMNLVDGGWVNVVPVSSLAELGADLTIAVDVALDVEDTQDLRHGLDVLFRTNAITRQKLKELQLKEADLVIRPDVEDIHWAEFARLEEAVARGERAMREALPEVRRLIRPVEPAVAPPVPESRQGLFKRLRAAMSGAGSRSNILLLCALLLAGSVWGCGQDASRAPAGEADVPSASLLATQMAFERVAREVVPAVVNIQAEGVRGRSSETGGLFEEGGVPDGWSALGEAGVQAGSGLIIGADGYILTNAHVIAGAKRIRVRLSDGLELLGREVGADTLTDLAVIKVDPPHPLTVARFGDSDTLRRGQWAIAIGNPFGLEHTLTVGVISATARSNIGLESYESFVQTDAAINPGNSGGPLVDIAGQVIGINNAVIAPGQGISFAIPINLAKEIQAQLIAKGGVTRGWLGVNIRRPAVPSETEGGLLIDSINNGSPAEAAGLREGDVLRAYGERAVSDLESLQRFVAHTPIGREVALTIERQGKIMHLPVVIATQVTEGMEAREAD